MKTEGIALIVAAGCLIAVGCAGTNGGGGGSAKRGVCRANLGRLYTATMLYTGDNDDFLPQSNWMDGITPYLQNASESLHCPSVVSSAYGYAFSQALVGVNTNTVSSPDGAPLIFDSTNLARNAVAPYSVAGVTRHLGALTVYLSSRIDPPSSKVPTVAETRATCLSRVRQISTALALYTSDNDDVFPAANWTDAVTPYLGLSRELIKCPSVPAGSFGYAFNSSLLGVSVTSLEVPAATPAVYDSPLLGRNAVSAFELPNPSRHAGNNVGYADGHAGTVGP